MENFRSPLELLKECNVATANLERIVSNAAQQMDETEEDTHNPTNNDVFTTSTESYNPDTSSSNNNNNVAFSPTRDVFNSPTQVFSNNNNTVFTTMSKAYSTPTSSGEVYSTARMTSTPGHITMAVHGGSSGGVQTQGPIKKVQGMQKFQIITPDSEIGQQLQQHLLHCKQSFMMRRALGSPVGVIGGVNGGMVASSGTPMTGNPRQQLLNYQHTQVMSVPVKNKIPRPPNAFMIFANQNRKDLANKNPTESNKQISVRLGNLWKAMSKDQKEKYFTMAKSVDQEHKRRYPDYVYNPKEARIKKAIRDQTRESHRMLNYKSPSPTKRTNSATVGGDVYNDQQYRKRGIRSQPGQSMPETMLPYESYMEVPYQPQGGFLSTPSNQWFPYVQPGASPQWTQGWGFPSSQSSPRGVPYVLPGTEGTMNNSSSNQGYVGYPNIQGETEHQQSGVSARRSDNVDMPRNSGQMMPSDPLLYLQQQQQQSQQQQPPQQLQMQQQQQQQQQQQATESSAVLTTLLNKTPNSGGSQQQQTTPGQQATPPSQSSRMTPTTSSSYRQYLGQTISSPTAASSPWPPNFYYTFSPNTADALPLPKIEPSVPECGSGNPYPCYPTSSGQFYYNYFLPGQSEGETIYATSPEPRHGYQFQQATPTSQPNKGQSQYILGGGFTNADMADREDQLYSECNMMDISNQTGKELTVSVSDHDMALKNGARVIASYETENNDTEYSHKLKKMKCEVDIDVVEDSKETDPFLPMSKPIPIPDNVDPSKIIHQNENVCVLTNDFVDDQNMSLSCMTDKQK